MIKIETSKIKTKRRTIHFFKKLVLDSIIYPEIKIEQLDLCPKGDERLDVAISICVEMTKEDLINFLRAGASPLERFDLGAIEEELPARITIEIFPSKELKKYIEEDEK